MGKSETKVTRAVREAVVKTAKGISKLEAKVMEKSIPAKKQVKKTAKEIMHFAAKKGAEAQKLSRKAVRTAKDAYKGFKEGIREVRRKKKQ